jgi:hypothetical protein
MAPSKGVEATDDPHGQNRRGVGKLAGDQAWRSQDADAQRAADDDGQAEADAEDADEAAG